MKIIMYHYVRKPADSLPYFNFLHAGDFAKQLDFFQSESTILAPADLREAFTTKTVPDGFLLTFDDGLKDHYTYVFPELQKRGLKAYFFISTGWYKHGRMLPVHRIHLLLGRFGGAQILQALKQIIQPAMISDEQQNNFASFTYPNQQNDATTLAVKQLLNFYIRSEYQEKVLDELMNKMGVDEKQEGENYYLSKSELHEMQETGMIIGSHTENHPVLSKLSLQEQQLEIQSAVEYFENELLLGTPDSFCYPYGYAGTYNNASLQALKENGFETAFVVNARELTTDDLLQHPLELPRFDCNLFPYGQIWQNIS